MQRIKAAIITVLAALVVSLGGLVPSGVASAATDCEAAVTDNAHLFSATDVNNVAAAVQKVENQGAVTHVVTVDSLSAYGNSLDKFERSLEASCPSWQNADGGRKNNLVVLAIGMNPHASGIYTGAQWNNSVAKQADSIRTDQMNPRFRDGEFAQGFVNGLNAVGESIDTHLHPKPAAPSKPVDLSWLLYTAIAIVSAALLVFFTVFGGRAFSRSRKAKAQRNSMQQKATQQRAELENNVVELSTKEGEFEQRLETLSAKLNDSDLHQPTAELNKLKDVSRQVASKYGSIEAQDPSRKLTYGQYEQIATTAGEGNKKAQQAFGLADTLDQMIGRLEQMIISMPTRLIEADAKLEQAKSAVAAIAQTGLRTGKSDTQLVEAHDSLANAHREHAKKDYSAAEEALQKGITSLEEAVTLARSLPATRHALLNRISGLRARLVTVSEDVSACFTLVRQLQQEFSAVCWKSVKDNPNNVEKLITGVGNSLNQADTAVRSQEWDNASKILDRAKENLDQSQKLLTETIQLSEKLKEIKQNSLQDARTILEKVSEVEAFVSGHSSDVDNVSSPLSKIRASVHNAEVELTTAGPNYLRVAELLQSANQSVEETHSKVKRQHAQKERERAEAAKKLQEARQAIERAKRHRSSMSSQTKRKLSEAERLLNQAESTNNLTQFLLWSQLISAANDAERHAQSDASSYSNYSSGYSSSSSSYGSSSGYDSSGGWGGGGGFDGGSSSSGGW